jgi:hypothetical protein
MFGQGRYTGGEFRGKDGWLKEPVEAGIGFCFINSIQTEDTRIRPATHQSTAFRSQDRWGD